MDHAKILRKMLNGCPDPRSYDEDLGRDHIMIIFGGVIGVTVAADIIPEWVASELSQWVIEQMTETLLELWDEDDG